MRLQIVVLLALYLPARAAPQEVLLKDGSRLRGILQKYEKGLAYILVVRDGSTKPTLTTVPENIVDKPATEGAQKQQREADQARQSNKASQEVGRTRPSPQTLPDPAVMPGPPVRYTGAGDRWARVFALDPRSPAGTAGLKAGDIITSIDGQRVGYTDVMEGRPQLSDKAVTVEIERNGEKHAYSVLPTFNGVRYAIGANILPEKKGKASTYSLVGSTSESDIKKLPVWGTPASRGQANESSSDSASALTPTRHNPRPLPALPVPAPSPSQEVVFTKYPCDYFLVDTSAGYALVESYSGDLPQKGDLIAGELDAFGFRDVYNLSSDEEMYVYVEDWGLSKEEALDRLYRECN